MEKKIEHSKKYRKFFIVSSGLFFVSRLISLIYISILYNLVEEEIIADMIILASFQSIFVGLLPMGVHYGVMQWTLRKQNSTNYLVTFFSYTLLITTPLIVLASLSTWIYIGFLPSFDLILYTLANLLALFMYMFSYVEVAKYNNHWVNIINASYSVLNSVLVPTLYVIGNQQLTEILLAWVLAGMFVVATVGSKNREIIKLVIAPSEWIKLVKYSLPVYLLSATNILIANLDRVFIDRFYDDLSLSGFYIAERFLLIGLQMVSIFLTGVSSMLIVLHNEDIQRFENVSRSIFRNLSIISIIVFTLMNANTEIIFLLFPDEYNFAIVWMKVLTFAFMMDAVIAYLMIRFLALEQKLPVLYIRAFSLILRYSVAYTLLDLGIQGLIIGIFSSSAAGFTLLTLGSKELRHWSKKSLMRFLLFCSISILSMVMANLYLVFPFENFAPILIISLAYIIKPLAKQDVEYITRILPQRLGRLSRIFVGLSHK